MGSANDTPNDCIELGLQLRSRVSLTYVWNEGSLLAAAREPSVINSDYDSLPLGSILANISKTEPFVILICRNTKPLSIRE
jgi:hypothetical protein